MSALLVAFIILLFGLVFLLVGGELLVSNASRFARRLGISPLLVGLTVVAFGTSLPELFISITASLKGYPEVMIGNVVGSNIANIGLILAISLLISPLRLSFKSVARELVLLHVVTVVFFVLAFYGYFPRLMGFVAVAVLAGYTVKAFRDERSGGNIGSGGVAGVNFVETERGDWKEASENESKQGGVATSIKMLLGLIALSGGAELFIRGAVAVAQGLGVSELVVGLTLAAIGTSLPELATCIAAIRQRQDAMLVGNIIGSNLFNLLMVLGVTASLFPFALPGVLLQRDLPLMLFFSLALFALIAWRGKLERLLGLGFLVIYICYIYGVKTFA